MQKVAIACLQHFGSVLERRIISRKYQVLALLLPSPPNSILKGRAHKQLLRAFFPARPGRKPAHIITEEGHAISGFQE